MSSSPQTIAATFYPGVRDAANASPITVMGGETRADFSLVLRDTYTVSGRLTATDPAAVGYYTVFAVSDAEVRDNARLADMAAKHESDARAVTVTPRSSADVLLRQN